MAVGQDTFFRGGMAADHGLHPRQQFQLAEWFGDVIVRAPFQSLYDVRFIRSDGQNDRGHR